MGLSLRSHDRRVGELEELGPEALAVGTCSHAWEEQDCGAGCAGVAKLSLDVGRGFKRRPSALGLASSQAFRGPLTIPRSTLVGCEASSAIAHRQMHYSTSVELAAKLGRSVEKSMETMAEGLIGRPWPGPILASRPSSGHAQAPLSQNL